MAPMMAYRTEDLMGYESLSRLFRLILLLMTFSSLTCQGIVSSQQLIKIIHVVKG
jgi:hypothetical protein